MSTRLALELRRAGLRWRPRPGDAFVLPDRGMDDEVFHLSQMTVEVHDFPTGQVIGFNGVTEWALDSVDRDEALWLPHEHQLRDLLGGIFRSLHVEAGEYVVTFDLPGAPGRRATARSAPDAYGKALLAVLRDVVADAAVSATAAGVS